MHEVDPNEYKIKGMLLGKSGSGKSQFAVTLPAPRLVIDFDGRSETLAGWPDTKVVRCLEPEPGSPKAWRAAEVLRKQLRSEVERGIFPFASVVYDGLTMLGRYALNWALTLDPKRGLGGAPAKQHYLPQMDALSKFVLSTMSFPVHTIWTGHPEILEDEETGGVFFTPKVTGKLRTEVANWFNECYHTYTGQDKDGNTRYYIRTDGTGRWDFFKSALNSLGRYWKSPIDVTIAPEKIGQPMGFELLLAKRFGRPPYVGTVIKPEEETES